MCEELKLKKLESEAWGFRLTGGRDFGTPLTVLRVTGAGVAEESGMEVGDMIVTINGMCAQSMTHVEAQQHIIGAGNNLVLQILRGSPVPAPELTTTPMRGMTPNIQHQRCESELTNDSHEHKLIESAFAHLHQCSHENEPSEEELQDQEIAEKMLENAELLEGNVIGVNFKRFIPKVDFIKNSLVYQVLQEEQVFKAKTEEEQLEKCPEKRFSTFMVHPTNLKPKVKKESTKLPKRPKTPLEPESKEKLEEKKIEKGEDQPKLELKPIASEEPKPTVTEEGEVKKRNERSNLEQTEKVEEKAPSIDIQINDEIIQPATEANQGDETNQVVDESLKPSQESGSSPVSVDISGAPLTTKQEILNAQQELPAIEEVQEETEEHPTEDSEFNKQLVLIKSQLENLRQLPSLIETQLNLFQNQIDSLVDLKNKEAKPNQPVPSVSSLQK
uniref:PDZ and LIM domain protein Zasp n=1 Tax=Cacopsylla melanoneura TaxID=428564 RepID=A0A8D8RTB4_9HEMI